ncbi:winged helix-turn-helix domain-containing protein [Aquicoccus porphyridii]|uniref:Winged helix-turn-helix domain-containing protein n=1 Tax=Aquicoccus porphyridii TaxID=1852029 RepID=A0A5A9Z502_9RHOB|nr:crosslink repair DNA glycosylase YcaQ family protein [Aquicoccus porphyridii]KAA0912224.1 winged helix-turn-helix domain-containing protein [Aquicoccus porphyridii]RAI52927.1 winged helix-turn-helix domain-containing protein [Rhodobacteraceae bacterium AsT-22]
MRLSNRMARWLWIEAQGLSRTPTGPLDLAGVIRNLGFVQLDAIRVVSRAHHHILWSRNQNYREPMLGNLLESREIFEHFTHDASLLPMEFLPMWQRQFRRRAARIRNASWWKGMPDAAGRAEIKARIEREGPLSTHDFDTRINGPRKMWQRPPHKLALDYMWYAGELATAHRRNFTKFYDLAERVFPPERLQAQIDDAEQVDWLCRAALRRCGFATAGEIQRFWEAMDSREVNAWIERNRKNLVSLEIEGADGTVAQAWAEPDIDTRLARLAKPTSRLRILNPFDPLIRDRARLKRLFGFDYRVEMFVPAAKRQWGYYVFPLLEGDRFVGRVEVRADRKKNLISLDKMWVEPGVVWSSARDERLSAELSRLSRLTGATEIRRP